MEFFNQCITCKSHRIKDLSKYAHSYLCKCADCSLVFSKRIPSTLELKEYYKSYTYNRETKVSPVTIKRYNELLDSFEKYRKLNRILDVGCGTGVFLQVAKKRGWETYGLELSAKAVEICKIAGIEAFEGTMDSVKEGIPEVDIIVSIEVLEHINNPLSEMANFNKKLREDGLLYITTPNFNAFGRYWFKERYAEIQYPEHLTHYTAPTLKKLAESNGFKSQKTETTGISFNTFYKEIKSQSSKTKISTISIDEQIRLKSEQGFVFAGLKYFGNLVFNITGTGATLKGWFIKEKEIS